MPEIIGEFITQESIKAKAASAFGLDQPSALDVVHRENYKSDVDYIHALTETQAKMDNPEYQKAARKVAAEDRRRQEEEIRKAQRREYDEILKSVKLDDIDKRAIDKEAAQEARRDLAAGKITLSELGQRIESYGEKLTDQKRRERAASIQFNRCLRGDNLT